MKIFYNREELLKEVKEVVLSHNLSVDYELRLSWKESMKDYEGPPIGFMPPEGWIDFGEHVVNFIISDEVAKGILSAVIWDTIKETFVLLKKGKKDNNEQVAIITDEYRINNTQAFFKNKSIYFVFYAHQSKEEVFEGIKQIEEVRKRLFNLLEIADINGKDDRLRLTYHGRWLIS